MTIRSMTRITTLIIALVLTSSTWAMGKKTNPAPSPSPSPKPSPKPSPVPTPPPPPPAPPVTPTPDPDDKYSYVDPKGLIPAAAKKIALEHYDRMKDDLENINYLSVIDFSAYSGKHRFFIIDMRSGEVETHKTAHGSGSDTNHDGYAESFSNTPESHQSSLGLYRTAETYNGKHGYSLKLDGLSSSNNKARSRAIVIHAADYVNDDTSSKSGRSWGCPAVDKQESNRLIDKLKWGSLIYAWHGRF